MATPSAYPSSILVSMLTSQHPRPDQVRMLERELALRGELDSAWAVRPLALAQYEARPVLILEDRPGDPLPRVLETSAMELGLILRLAASLAAVLGEVHRRGIIHKNVKPAHVLVNADSGQVWLTGFGIASRLPRERQAPDPPEIIAGTLAYMAPEQTGRMNRSIDARSDLYALGVTLYEMLTGSLPFTAADPMEWVHCHIARQAMAPSERVKHAPPPVSAIIMKLLAKTAEERYQTAAALERDLRRCLAQFEAEGCIDGFPLGERDTPDRLLIPEKLYGRAQEVQTLLAAFDRIVQGSAPELVLFSGYSGIGKSAVVNELHKVLVPPRGLFAAGKFDQYKRDIPYSTLAQAFQSLVRSLLTKSDAELANWREALRDALGPNGQLMVDLVPELKLVIGEQPSVPELPLQDAQRRFQLIFLRFLTVFARPEHPLALFLDDLQWLDAATLDLLEELLTQADLRHLLLIGAYRDNEVTTTHPLMRKLETIRGSGRVQDIKLGPLTAEDLVGLVADSLRCDAKRATPLAGLVNAKTGGNPFFVSQFLHVLADEGLVAFDHKRARWSWDLDAIYAKRYTDNVAELLAGKLTRLPLDTQDALRQFACLGSVADVAILSIALGTPEEQVHAALAEALRQQLIQRFERSYKFVHDRVQEAAYALIPEESRAQAHLKIGWLLLAHTPPEKLDEAIFEIVNQLDRGAPLITLREEREQLAELNLIAGKRAKGAAAWASALNYLIAGIALVPEDGWERLHDLIFELQLHRAECEFLTGEMTSAEEHLRMISSRAADTVQRAAVACLLTDLYFALRQPDRAVAECLGCLRHAGLDIPLQTTEAQAQAAFDRIRSRLDGLGIEEFAALPLMTDSASRALMDVMGKVAPSAWYLDKNLLSVIVCSAVDLSLERGHCDSSCVAYVFLGLSACWRFGDFEAGWRFGRLAHKLSESKRLRRFEAFVCLILSSCIQQWVTHVVRSRELIRTAFDVASRSCDRLSAVGSRGELVSNLLMAGDPLVEAEKEAEVGLEFCRRAAYADYIDRAATQAAFIRSLRGLTRQFGSLDDARFDERRMQEHFATRPHLFTIEGWYWIRKLHARFLAGDYTAALDASTRAQALSWSLSSSIELADHELFSALTHVAVCDSTSPDERQRHLDAVAAHLQQLEAWARHCPENFENCAMLVAAETARVEGRDPDAMRLYEQAIGSARENGFIHHEALALELAARFYSARGFDRIAKSYLRDARHGYLQWGADGKVRQLEELHPHLKEENRRLDPMHTVETPVEQLDLAAVLSVSEAVSGEIDLEKLIATVMRLGLVHAGAERGLLILPRGDTHRIEAEVRIDDGVVTVALRQTGVTAVDLPESVFQYVLRTRETVLLDDASAGSAFSDDHYLRRHRARSVLCMPLLEQTRMVGVLYLENSLTSGAFTTARMALLKVLASEAVISIENARLYRDLQEREARVRRLVDSNIIGIVIWHTDGRIIDTNEAFLRIVGHDREDLVSGRVRWNDLSPPGWRDHDARVMAEVKAVGTVQAHDREFLRKDGTLVSVLIGRAIFDGSADEGVAFVLDLTERKRAEQALRESERESQLIVHTIPGLVAMLRPSGEVDFVNQELIAYCGQPLEAMKQWGTNGTVHSEDLPRVVQDFTRAITSGEPYDFEARIRRFDGVYRWLQIRGLPLRDTSGQIVRWYVLLSDIDDRKRAESDVRRAYERFAEAQRVAALSTLTASIAHEVNQPLSGIITNAGTCLRMLNADPPNIDGARETARRTIRDGNRASEVIARLRALFSKREFTLESMDLNEAAREVIALSSNELQRNRILLQMELPDDLPVVTGDRIQLQQVVLNLVRNASDAMVDVHDRPRQLLVKTEREDSGRVRLSVRDAGVGLSPQSLDSLFDPFYTTKSGGMGIGLFVSRSIVERHHGRLWAEPNQGAPGATFAFSIPHGQHR